jgi:hypothetical protein
MGMAAGADGVFHPVWPDARHGAFQTYTARVTVEPASTPVPAAPRDAALAEEKIDGRVAIDVDPLEWSGETREVVIPIRFRNTSTETFFPPIVATVTSLAAGAEILNAGNGKPGDGATMDYTRALRDLPALAPGTATETVGWRVRVPSRRANGIALRLSVTGRVAKGTP